MTWTYTLAYQNGSQATYATDIADDQTVNWDAVNWGIDPKLARVVRASDTGQSVTVYTKKTVSGPVFADLPFQVTPAMAVFAVLATVGLGMYVLNKEAERREVARV